MRVDKEYLGQLREDFQWCVQRRDVSVFRRQRKNYDTRYCIWPGQSDDGRKWGKDPFPWPGAADSRVPLVDLYINQDVAFLMMLWRRNRTIVSGTEVNDSDYANRLTQVLRWMKYTQMTEAPREMRLLANYFCERGAGVLFTCWDKRTQLGYDELDLETLQGLAQDIYGAAQNGMEPGERELRIMELPAMILDPSREKQSAEALASIYEDVSAPRLLKVVRELRANGHSRFPRPYLIRNRPALTALAPNEDVFIDPEATEFQTASGIHRRELLTESQLRERERSHEWDHEFIELMLQKARGQVTSDFDGNLFQRRTARTGTGVKSPDRLFEVIHSYRRLADDDGVPGIYYTVFSPHLVVDETYALHTLLDYDHGEYPGVFYSREVRSRLLDDSRGIGEIGYTWQQQIKTEWDSRIDRAAIATLPPYYYPEGQPPDAWGPGVGVPTSRPEEYGFMQTPKFDLGSKEVQETVRHFADEYFGRSTEELKQVGNSVLRQDLGDLWMGYNAQADTQSLQLCQQYMPDDFYFRIVGSAKGKPIHATREEIQGQFDVSINYNVADLDDAKVKEKMGLIETALQLDTTGRVDRDEALTVAFELVDPNLGERLLRDPQEASQAEIDDEDSAFAKMWAGIPVDVKPSGQAYRLRMQRLQNVLQVNKAAQQRYMSDEQFRELIDRRMKQFQFQIAQHEVNPMVGKIGDTPASVLMQGPQGP